MSGAAGSPTYDPSLDILSADVATNATMITAVIRVKQLTQTDSSWQFGRHGASGVSAFALPASHASLSIASTMPLPHTGSVQSCSHAVPSMFWPLSHCSPFWASTIALPHVSFDWQSGEQPSPAVLLPSSQTSPVSTRPLPQPAGKHSPPKHVPLIVVCVRSTYVHAAPSAAPLHALI